MADNRFYAEQSDCCGKLNLKNKGKIKMAKTAADLLVVKKTFTIYLSIS